MSSLLCLVGILLVGGGLQYPPINLKDPTVVQTGSTIFARSCSVGYCHGKEGRVGRGPRLRGKKWKASYLFRVTAEGIPSSAMPAWTGKLSEQEIWSVVAYILTLSPPNSEQSLSSAPDRIVGARDQPIPLMTSKLLPKESQATRLGISGDPKKGRELFFDSSDDLSCAICHRLKGVGATVGPDLSQLGERPIKEILWDILLPSSRLSVGGQLWKLTTQTGEQIEVLKGEQGNGWIKVYDMTGLPPVLRTIEKKHILELKPQTGSAMPGSYGRRYSLKQLLDLVSFLKSENLDTPFPVNVEDVLNPLSSLKSDRVK